MCRFISILFIGVISIKAHSQITGIKIIGDTCSSLTLDLQALGTSSSSYFFWDFDDPASGVDDTITITGFSPVPFPTHTFSSPGVYTVCVSFQEPGFPVTTICRTLTMGLCCTGVIAVSDTCIQNDITFTVITAENLTSIVWDFGDPASGPNNNSASLSPTHVFSSPGIYTITANANAPCGSFQMSYVVNAVDCASDCSGTLVTNDSCLVNGTSFQISSTNGVNAVFWNFGDPISGNSNTSVLETPTHFFSTAGTYAVQCIVQFSCGADTLYETISVIDCDTLIEQNCELFVPNVFSPNEDGTNDKLFPNMNCPMENYNFQVFNRWGELVFDTSIQFAKWDGKFNGKECLDGVYVYLIHYNFYGQQMKNVCGNVTLVR